MRRASFLSAACAVLLLSAGCDAGMDNDRGTVDDQTAAARDQTPAGTTDQMSAGGAQRFVQQAAIGNMAEVELGQLASQRAQNSEVKQFAQQMIQAHTKALNELKSAGNTANASIPSELDEKHRDIQQRLSGLQGAEFDREYMEVMVDAHEDMADLLENRAGDARRGATAGGSDTTAGSPSNAQSGGNDAALNQWAAKMLPDVQQHLETAKQLKERVDKAR